MGRSLRSFAVLVLGYFAVLEAMLWLSLVFWPDFEANLKLLKVMTKIAPIRELVDVLREGELPGYIVFQHFFKGCLFLGGAAAVLFAVNAVAAEAHRGTLEILLSRPQSRLRILLERWLFGALALLLPVFASTWTIPTLVERVEETIELQPLMLGAVHMSCMLLAIYSGTFFLSTIGRHPVRIAIGALFFAVFELATYFVMEATNWSVVRFVDPRLFVDIFTRKSLDWEICGGLLAFAGLATVASLIAFQHRKP